MRVRALTVAGDYSFGASAANFLANTPAAVAQVVLTRLRLVLGEWFVDTTQGTPYPTQVIGAGTKPYYDNAIKQVILGTVGVVRITAYQSVLNPNTRALTIAAVIDTQYGQAYVAPTVVPIVPTFKYAQTDAGTPGISDAGQIIEV